MGGHKKGSTTRKKEKNREVLRNLQRLTIDEIEKKTKNDATKKNKRNKK